MRTIWKGSFPAVVTPFDKDGNLDKTSLRKMLRLLMDDGCSGVVMTADNGEWWALTDDERKTVYDIAVEECKGKITVIGTTTGFYSEKRVMNLTKYAKDIGMDGVMLHAPYLRLSERETINFYKRISKIGIPMMLYNIPRKLPVELDIHLTKKLSDEIPNFVAVKEAERDFWKVSDKLKLLSKELAFFIGPCTLIFPGLCLGAVGYVSTGPEFLGKECEDIIKLVKNKEIEKAIKIHHRLSDMYHVFDDPSMGEWRAKLKYALNLVGKPAGYPRKPVEPLTEEVKKYIKQEMTKIGFL